MSLANSDGIDQKRCYLINFKGHLSKYNFLSSEMNTIVSLKIKAKNFALLPRKKKRIKKTFANARS